MMRNVLDFTVFRFKVSLFREENNSGQCRHENDPSGPEFCVVFLRKSQASDTNGVNPVSRGRGGSLRHLWVLIWCS